MSGEGEGGDVEVGGLGGECGVEGRGIGGRGDVG